MSDRRVSWKITMRGLESMRRIFGLLALMFVVAVGGSAWGQQVKAAAWTAQWIGAPWSTVRDGAEADGSRPMPIFRREFEVRGRVAKATLRIAGMGQFEARMGSSTGVEMIGKPGLHEAWTDYRKTVAYETYDVTAMLQPGPHALGVMLGNGMYNVQRTSLGGKSQRYTKLEGSFGAPKLIAELRVEYADGKTERIGTDEGWSAARGPVVFSSTFGGEDYDARKAPAGWDRPEFGSDAWERVKTVEGPGGTLVAALAPEVLQAGTHASVSSKDVGQGRVVYDLGQNFAGVVEVRVKGPAGASLKLTPGELLRADGAVDQRSSGRPMWWTYTLRGDGEGEVWAPQFGYYGFRYVQAEWVGAEGSGTVATVTGIPWHSASAKTGTFESSNAMLNAIDKLIVEAMHNNEATLMTDCPHREKLGWLEETHIVAAGLMYNNDLRGLYAATAQNMADAQRADGNVPTIAPHYTQFGAVGSRFDDSPEWGSAAVLAPWAAYRFYGDRAELTRVYPMMQRYVASLESRAVGGIVAFGLGDWYDIGPGEPGVSKLTTLGVTGTLMLYEDAAAMQKIATLLGRREEAARYGKLAGQEAEAFNAKYFDAAKGFYDRGSQTAQAMPLALGIVPAALKAKVLETLLADIHAHQEHVTTGEIGYPYLLRALMQNGRSDVAMAMMMRKDAPSYGSQLAAGATALTEAWDANPRSSQDHFMLGGAEEWFYRGLGGINVDMSRVVTAERITIRPQVVEGADWVKTTFASTLGTVKTEWRREGKNVVVMVTVPVASTVEFPGVRKVVEAGVHRFSVPF
jgi:alpha-L-rhamnosidase